MLIYRRTQKHVSTCSLKVNSNHKNRSVFRERPKICDIVNAVISGGMNTKVISENLKVPAKYKNSSNEIL
jgi:hypothetical protein